MRRPSPTRQPEEMNSSSDQDVETFASLHFYLSTACVVSYSMTFILGIIGNSLVIWITGFKLKSVSAVWFLNLAVTDLICNIALPLRIAQWMMFIVGFSVTFILCEISTPLIFFNMLTSVYFLAIISIDRCVSVMCPIWSKIHRTPRLAKIISGIVWMLCLIISVPYVTFYNFLTELTDCNNKIMLSFIKFHTAVYQALLTPKLVLLFVLPFLIISICSALVALKLKTLRRPVGSRKPFKVITAVVLCFFICWFPYGIWPVILIDQKYWKEDFTIYEICVCLAYFNSCINPILYICFSRDFKDRFTLRSLPARLKSVLNDGEETSGETDNPTDRLNTSSL
uniref:G-protein coupled receptors family 1 profile domain-containing protein n=1 Tax=Leptobrachium leishanense TaxID=445787 RepID=A0A8C5QC65_9ANUR